MRFRLIEEYLFEDIEAVRKNYPKISDNDFNTIIRLDPTFQENRDSVGKYGKWLLSLYDKGKLEITDNITSILKEFDDNKKFLKDKDIGKFKSIEDVASYINNDDNYNEMSHRQEVRQRQKDRKNANLVQDADLVFENDNWLVYVPKTYAASCKLGQGTQWCTATTENDYYYKRYTDKGKLYININKHNPEEKYQFHFETKSYMDDKDEPIGIIDFFVDNPDLFKFYKTVISDDAEMKNGGRIIPTVSFILKNQSGTFVYSKDNAKLFEKYGIFLRRKLKHLIIDKSISIIPDRLCSAFPYLQSVDMPDGITSIGNLAFNDCISLASITIPDSVTHIGSSAFSGCTALSDINIPKNVYKIGAWAFSGCFLEALRIQGESIDIGQGAFFGSGLKSVTIVGDDVNIQTSAFAACKSLQLVDIPKGVTSIGVGAFSGCTSLTSITIPDGETSIGNMAFSSCHSLTSITIPDGVTRISDKVFISCISLTSITIPSSVTSIGEKAFIDCGNLKEVFYTGTKEQWDDLKDNSDRRGNDYLFNANITFTP